MGKRGRGYASILRLGVVMDNKNGGKVIKGEGKPLPLLATLIQGGYNRKD